MFLAMGPGGALAFKKLNCKYNVVLWHRNVSCGLVLNQWEAFPNGRAFFVSEIANFNSRERVNPALAGFEGNSSYNSPFCTKIGTLFGIPKIF